ncbi:MULTISPECIES: PilN domain-containing protein [Enterovibrio]|uniref:Pilus assembly protein PilN n=1 Tax=Enterovibrio norvegicus FF-454 TaxID=1185651 RepID=A0A1E5CG14_9GAMM|nr:PilN domain-containing protein [Enterovibrio norvegicus]OEE64450.1 pilus assembly protein PilN [Enterovibrio norvegicus FF-454]OEE90379.1 pilus assembly protein PilN [Enterovibrio norvegicus FF-162]
MIVSINLLPWRDSKRLAMRRRFFHKIMIAILVVAGCVGMSRWVIYQQLNTQETRNARLQTEIDSLNSTLRTFAKREIERDALHRRLTLVNSLQKQRNNATMLFNLLPQITPDGVVLDKVSMTSAKVSIEGRSRSNAQLASLLALLEDDVGADNVQIHSIISDSSRPTLVEKRFKATFELVGYVIPNLPQEKKNDS